MTPNNALESGRAKSGAPAQRERQLAMASAESVELHIFSVTRSIFRKGEEQ